ncbi:high frequency lysogenization protein HflD [Marinobacterium zhoushanense]|uniref:High frequency lysogenization protein HflD homolog n=1 Tax=Marinobacterium zhoushanense TaxID=1679163 RepID=A0ABQ1KAJ1_9GAMM|nr:lysogenization regulator HflD [Marinobacterium zhoushanense]GGB90788.1 high frequency lysogenization protein HflD [Marinobacterium zhoushanense]
MARAHDEQAIALAGVFQAASLVEQIARRGMVAQNSYEASIASLFVSDPKTTEDVYGGTRDLPFNLSLGLKQMQELVDKRAGGLNQDVMRYALSMIQLERKLSARPDMLDEIGKRLDQLAGKAQYFGGSSETQAQPDNLPDPSIYTHANVIAGIAALYQDTLSTFSTRIQVGGDPRHLQNSENAARIRALLLAGIRAVILWRQVGGKRWHLFFFKSRVRPSLNKIGSTT